MSRQTNTPDGAFTVLPKHRVSDPTLLEKSLKMFNRGVITLTEHTHFSAWLSKRGEMESKDEALKQEYFASLKS